MNIKDLVKSIAANPQAHQVDREAKMEATINVMCENMQKQADMKSQTRNRAEISTDRGYGQGRRMGD